jgi:hypothetical protein
VISSRRRPLRLALPVLAAFLVAVSCSSSDSAAGPAIPAPTGEAARHCRALQKALPQTVKGLERRATVPASDFTALWGDPAVQLRCGVPKPEVLTFGSEHYNPYADAAEVNGVTWLFEKQRAGYRFTTVLRKSYVEVTVPGRYAPEIDVLTGLAGAVRKTVPAGV